MAPLSSFLASLAAVAGILAPLVDAAPGRSSRLGGNFLGVPVSNADATDLIPNSYIVVYNNTFDDEVISAHQIKAMSKISRRNIGKRSLDGRDMSTSVRQMALGTWRAMMLDADDRTIMEIMEDETVAYVEQDARVQVRLPQEPAVEEDGEMHAYVEPVVRPLTEKRATAVQRNAPNGLARLSSAAAGGTTYSFDSTAGEGITVYIVDTGVRTTHQEFQGRATWGANFVNRVNTDENGHGSHVAGTVAGATFGVAKKANIVAVKVLDAQGAGTNSGVIDGMNWVAQNASASGVSRKAVMNMSLGGSRSNAVNAAINALRAQGVVPVVAAGNENQDAANSSPASAAGAITVGAIDQRNDRKASFSNFGRFVDIFAPGVSVLSVDATSDTGSKSLSGTSMASPHVAGLAAYMIALNPALTSGGNLNGVADAVAQEMIARATAITARVRNNAAGTTNLIANNGNQ